MSNNGAALAKHEPAPELSVLEQVVINGDLKRLSVNDRIAYYRMRCEAAGLSPETQPFNYLDLQGKLTLYATKTATEQLCMKHGLSCEIVNEGIVTGDLYRVQARVIGKDGRHSDNIGVVNVANLKGEGMANAMMKATTKAYRRAVLAHCGMGALDETEIESIPDAQTVPLAVVHEQAATEPPQAPTASRLSREAYDAIKGLSYALWGTEGAAQGTTEAKEALGITAKTRELTPEQADKLLRALTEARDKLRADVPAAHDYEAAHLATTMNPPPDDPDPFGPDVTDDPWPDS